MPPRQPDLLDWTPPEPVAAFAPEQVRGATLEARIARAVSVALQDCKLTRDEVAARMTGWLGTKVTVNMLNAYASVARGDHPIGLTRFIALVQATGDRRLLELLAEMFGWAAPFSARYPTRPGCKPSSLPCWRGSCGTGWSACSPMA